MSQNITKWILYLFFVALTQCLLIRLRRKVQSISHDAYDHRMRFWSALTRIIQRKKRNITATDGIGPHNTSIVLQAGHLSLSLCNLFCFFFWCMGLASTVLSRTCSKGTVPFNICHETIDSSDTDNWLGVIAGYGPTIILWFQKFFCIVILPLPQML